MKYALHISSLYKDLLKKIPTKKDEFTIFTLIFITHLLFLIFSSNLLLWDENVYLSNAKKILGLSEYSEDYRFPLISWISAIFIYIFGYEPTLIKILLVFIFSISSVFLFILVQYIFRDKLLSYVSAILYSLNGVNLFWSSKIYPDVLGESLLVLSMSFFVYYLKKQRNLYAFLYVLFGFLSFLAKFYYIVWLTFSLLYLILNNKKLIILPSVVYVLLFISYGYVTWEQYGKPFGNVIEQWNVAYSWQKQETFTKFIANSTYFLGFLFYFPILYFIYYLLINKNKIFSNIKKLLRENPFILSLISYTVFMIIFLSVVVKQKDWRYFTTIIPTLAILNIYILKKHNNFILPIGFLLLFSTGISTLSSISRQITYNYCWDGYDIISFSINYLKENNATSVLSNCCWVWFANYLNIKSYSLWNNNTSLFVDKYNVDYIVYSPTYGLLDVILDKKYLKSNYVYFEDYCGNKVYIIEV